MINDPKQKNPQDKQDMDKGQKGGQSQTKTDDMGRPMSDDQTQGMDDTQGDDMDRTQGSM